MATDTEVFYKTMSIPKAAYILIRGFKVLRAERMGKKVLLCFPAEAFEAANEFANGGICQANEYWQAINDIKDVLFEAQRNL